MTNFKTMIITGILLVGTTAVSFASEGIIAAGTGGGTVAETMNSGGYSYIRLNEDDSWIASSPASISVGDKVRYTGGAVMKDFHSRTLDRNFESILLVQKLEVIDQINKDGVSAANNNPHTMLENTSSNATMVGNVKPLAGGTTIGEIYSGLGQLKGQQVALRARVMKVSKNVMGKNWVTLQDGSGTEPDNHLMATSSEIVATGDLVTVSGIIDTNVELGYGYNYKALLEEATFSYQE